MDKRTYFVSYLFTDVDHRGQTSSGSGSCGLDHDGPINSMGKVDEICRRIKESGKLSTVTILNWIPLNAD